ncbi:MAG TPA: hypothetical protein VK034_14865, partial [Enhygromyxa sp.]|nr:hypothetical protein [Enhygromyxa sp.]
MREAGGSGRRRESGRSARSPGWLLMLVTGCGAEPVEARAIWVDEAGGDGSRRIHVYDRGELESFEVLGDNEPVQRVLLDPRGRGLVVRVGDRRGAWFDLDDGRRLPLVLPFDLDNSRSNIGFADGALTWIDEFNDGALTVVPLAAGIPLERRDDGTVVALSRGAGLSWSVAAARAPISFAGDSASGRASFFRYPTRADQPLVIALEAEAEGLALPPDTEEQTVCRRIIGCPKVIVDPRGELAFFAKSPDGSEPDDRWQIFERRSPASAGPLELPPGLVGARALAALDRWVSIWFDENQLFHYDRRRGTVDSLPRAGSLSLYPFSVERGSAMILASRAGQVYRADLDGLRAVSLETTECQGSGQPVVSPSGRWIAWSCSEFGYLDDFTSVPSSAVLRVSEAGLERYVGVSMATLAI